MCPLMTQTNPLQVILLLIIWVEDNKNLYFEFNNVLKARISIPLEDMNPVKTRKHLLRFLSEDLERTDIPLSESLSKIFKL